MKQFLYLDTDIAIPSSLNQKKGLYKSNLKKAKTTRLKALMSAEAWKDLEQQKVLSLN